MDESENGRNLAESGSYKTVIQKQERIKTESYSAIAQNGRAAQNVTSDTENVTKKYGAEYVSTEYPGK